MRTNDTYVVNDKHLLTVSPQVYRSADQFTVDSLTTADRRKVAKLVKSLKYPVAFFHLQINFNAHKQEILYLSVGELSVYHNRKYPPAAAQHLGAFN